MQQAVTQTDHIVVPRALPKLRVEDIPEPPRARWIAVITAPNRERDANLHIRRAKFWTFFPQRLVSIKHAHREFDSLRAYLDGYVFVQLLPRQDWTIIEELPNVAGFLRNANGPHPIPDRDMAGLMVKADPDGLVKEPPKPAELRVIFDSGEHIKIVEGPFSSFTAIVTDGVDNEGYIGVDAEVFRGLTPMRLPAGWVKRL